MAGLLQAGAPRRALSRSAPLLAGLVVQAGATYLTLIVAGRLLGAARFGGLSALYVMVTSVATGLFLPLEQEVARRRGAERESGAVETTLAARAMRLGLSLAALLAVVSLVWHSAIGALFNGNVALLVAWCVALPGYACCFVSRGVFAGTGELRRYGVQLGAEGVFRLVGVLALAAIGEHRAAGVGWLFAAAPWIALAISLAGRRPPARPTAGDNRAPLLRPLGWLLVSSVASQLLVNAGPLVIQLLTTTAQRAEAGAFLAALVVVRIPVFLFTAVQPSFLPAMAAHAAADRRTEFGALLARVLALCAVLTLVSTALLALLGPFAIRLLFGFQHGLNRLGFLAMGASVGLFLVAAVLAQALLGRGRHAATTLGWLLGLAGLALGTVVSGSPVERATTGFLCGALVSALTFAVLLGLELRAWNSTAGAASSGVGRHRPGGHAASDDREPRRPVPVLAEAAAAPSASNDNFSVIEPQPLAATPVAEPVVAATREPPWAPALRLVLALTVSAAICLLWWHREPRILSVPQDIVGYPAFANWDYAPWFLAYRLVVYAFPLITLAVFLLLGWRGPLRRRPGFARPIVLRTAEEPDRPTRPIAQLLSLSGRLGLPMIVIAIEADGHARASRVNLHGVLYGFAYGAGIVCAAGLAAVVLNRPQDRRGIWEVVRAWARWIGLLNGLLAGAACLLGLWVMTRSTSVYVRADQTYHLYPWLPWWTGVPLAVSAGAWALWRLLGRRDPARIEALTVKVVVGSVFVFLATSTVPKALAYFQGFDDSQWLAGARALRQGGFPWRDFYVIHGLFYDVFQGNISLALFGNSVWGAQAGIAVVIVPLAWVGLYLFAVWVCRRNAWILILGGLLLLSGLPAQIEQRFIFVPLALVLFGETVARRSARWCAALATTLVVLELIVPETLFMSVPIVVALAAADFVHRDPNRPLRAAFRRTYWVLGTGAVLCAAWAIFLAANHALHAFIRYYIIFGPGHDASGAIPAEDISTKLWVEFALGPALVLVTYLTVVIRLRRRAGWTPRQWVAVAAGGFAALYGEKALGRFDKAHIDQAFTVTMPLLIIQAEATLTWADRMIRKAGRALRSRVGVRLAMPIRHPVTALALVTVVAVLLPVYANLSVVGELHYLPGRQHRSVAAAETIPHVGYIVPGAVNAERISDLRSVIDTYAPPGAPVFDMANAPGYLQYLLDRDPGTRFIDVSMAIPEYAQRLLIDDLERSRPPVVVYQRLGMGLPVWDGVQNQVRHYLVSRYVLQNYTPIVGTDGEIVMLRNDLVASAPPVPPLLGPSSTDHLYFQDSMCNWGDIPNFLPSKRVGPMTTLPVEAAGSVTHASGWAIDPQTNGPVARFYLMVNGRVVGTAQSLFRRVASIGQFHNPSAATSAFSTLIPLQTHGSVAVLALTSDGLLHPLRQGEPQGVSIPAKVHVPRGAVLPVGAPIPGNLEPTAPTRVGEVRLPAGTDLARFDLLELRANGVLGDAQMVISDTVPPSGVGHQIVANALPSSGSTLAVRVGSCMPWYGYAARKLYIAQTAGAPITSINLSATS